MARARHRAHYQQARERRRVDKQQQQTQSRQRRPARAEASILRFAAAPAARVSVQGTQLLLPDSVLDMVMARLASCLEPGGVYGPSLVARDLANASLVGLSGLLACCCCRCWSCCCRCSKSCMHPICKWIFVQKPICTALLAAAQPVVSCYCLRAPQAPARQQGPTCLPHQQQRCPLLPSSIPFLQALAA